MRLKNKWFQVSCDGGAATGKTTGAKLIAKKFHLKFLSSGLLYRYVSYLILKNNPKNKIKFVSLKFSKLNYSNLKRLNLHTPEISKNSSMYAKNPRIRNILKKYQVRFSKKNKKCCIEGRDISTKILPKSDIKFYFICNLKIASERRYKDLKRKKINVNLKDVKKALRIRNFIDKNRQNSPLLKHRDSIEIDTGKLGKTAMLNKMSKHIEKVLNKKYGN